MILVIIWVLFSVMVLVFLARLLALFNSSSSPGSKLCWAMSSIWKSRKSFSWVEASARLRAVSSLDLALW